MVKGHRAIRCPSRMFAMTLTYDQTHALSAAQNSNASKELLEISPAALDILGRTQEAGILSASPGVLLVEDGADDAVLVVVDHVAEPAAYLSEVCSRARCVGDLG